MGDRAYFVFVSEVHQEVGPVISTHWGGGNALYWLTDVKNCIDPGCPEEVSYASAQAVIRVNAYRPEQPSNVRVFSPPPGDFQTQLKTLKSKRFSPGDSGVFLVFVDQDPWRVENYDGSGFDEYTPHEGLTLLSNKLASISRVKALTEDDDD